MKRILFFIQNIFKKIWNAYADALALKDFRSAELSSKKGNIGAAVCITSSNRTATRYSTNNIPFCEIKCY